MKFGITNINNFDPVGDIDLGQSTVTIDAQITNMAMYNYEPNAWDGIRETLRMVPLYHPLWRPDSKLGQSLWITPGDVTVIPVMPTPELDLPLLPIELWVPDDDTSSRCHTPIPCPKCSHTFNSLGALVHHCRQQLCPVMGNNNDPGANVDSGDTEQDAIDREYWDSYLQCQFEGCTATFKRQDALDTHAATHNGSRPFKCSFEGCTKSFFTKTKLKRHEKRHSPGRPYQCDVGTCTASYKHMGNLVKHKKRAHCEEKPYKCDFEGCTAAFTGPDYLKSHMRTHSNERPYKCEFGTCEAAFKHKNSLKKHMKTHLGE